MALANENSSSIASSRLNYLDTKDQFKWYGNFKDLICLVKTLLEFTEDGEISDPADKMFSFKMGDIIVKRYSSTDTVQTQGSGYAILRDNWKNMFLSVADQHSPPKTKRVRQKASPWLTRDITALFSRETELN